MILKNIDIVCNVTVQDKKFLFLVLDEAIKQKDTDFVQFLLKVYAFSLEELSTAKIKAMNNEKIETLIQTTIDNKCIDLFVSNLFTSKALKIVVSAGIITLIFKKLFSRNS